MWNFFFSNCEEPYFSFMPGLTLLGIDDNISDRIDFFLSINKKKDVIWTNSGFSSDYKNPGSGWQGWLTSLTVWQQVAFVLSWLFFRLTDSCLQGGCPAPGFSSVLILGGRGAISVWNILFSGRRPWSEWHSAVKNTHCSWQGPSPFPSAVIGLVVHSSL